MRYSSLTSKRKNNSVMLEELLGPSTALWVK